MKNHESFHSNPNANNGAEFTKEEMHQKKLVGYLVSGGNLDYISERNGANWSEVSFKDEDVLFEMMHEDGGRIKKLEHGLLEKIKMPSQKNSVGEVFDTVSDKHGKRILTYMTGGEWENYASTGPTELANFLQKYPTPMDFENEAVVFLNIIREKNSVAKAQEYNLAMDNFCQKVYGKRYEYYKSIKALHKEAEERNRLFHPEIRRGAGEKPVKECGGYSLNKIHTTPNMNPNRPNEDAMYFNEDRGIIGVFDGVGGVVGGNIASNAAAGVLKSVAENYDIHSPNELKNALIFANQAVCNTVGGGMTTAVVGKINEEHGRKQLIYGCVGDSRIYVIRNGDAHQITRDEGFLNIIDNALGYKGKSGTDIVKQIGVFPLMEGDQLLFCSDGITGDKPEDAIPTKEIASIILGARNTTEAAAALASRATKRDDRTAVVVKV